MIYKEFLTPVSEVYSDPMDELRILFFTDPHAHHTVPSSRKDDYPYTILKKITDLAIVAKTYQVDAVLIGGDLFHGKAQTDQYISEVIHAFRSFSCPVFSILGNHDVYYGRSDTVHRTPFGVLFSSQAIKRLGTVAINNVGGKKVYIRGLDFMMNPKIPSDVPDGYDYLFLVSHQLMPGVLEEFAADECFKEEDIQSCKFTHILNGHDHMTYAPAERYGKVIIRPGAISRGTRSVSNRFRDISFSIFSITSNGIQYSQEKLPVLPASEIFSAEEIQTSDLSKKITEFVRSLKSTSPVENKSSVDSFIVKYCAGNMELIKYVRSYFIDAGLI